MRTRAPLKREVGSGALQPQDSGGGGRAPTPRLRVAAAAPTARARPGRRSLVARANDSGVLLELWDGNRMVKELQVNKGCGGSGNFTRAAKFAAEGGQPGGAQLARCRTVEAARRGPLTWQPLQAPLPHPNPQPRPNPQPTPLDPPPTCPRPQVPKALHGPMINDGWFSRGAAWSPDEGRVAYVAEVGGRSGFVAAFAFPHGGLDHAATALAMETV
jgi:hypothetical protein